MGFDRGERVFGRDAERLWNRDPRSIFGYTPQLLGKPFNHSFIEQQKHHFPYTISEDPSRGGAILLPVTEAQDGSGSEYTPEEIVAMILNVARQTVKESLETEIPDVVLVVPPSYTQHERLALKTAASIAGLNVLSYIHTGSAIALNFALTRTREELAEPQHVLFYDMGASQTSVSLAYFSHVPGPSKTKAEDMVPQIQIIATAWDETLGGREFDHRLAHYLAEKASEISGQNMFDHPRAMAALLREARRVKEVLSANTASKVMIEGLLGDFDFKYDITRATFEALCADLIQRVSAPLLQVLQSSSLSTDDIASLEIFGGGTRIPAIQDAISNAFSNRPVSKRLNSDDAAALGATFFAASVTSTFKVKTQYRVKDITSFPVLVNVTSGGGLSEADRMTTIVRPENRLGTRKTLSFRTSDPTPLELDLFYPPEAVPQGTPLALNHFRITNLPDPSVDKIIDDFKVVLSFRLEKGGLVTLEQAEAQYSIEEMVLQDPLPVESNPTPSEESSETPSSESNDATPTSESNDATPTSESDEVPSSEDLPASDETSQESTSEQESATLNDQTPPEVPPPILVPKISQRTKNLNIETDFSGLIPLTAAGIRSARSAIHRFERAEKLIADTAEARNSLETFIYDVRDRIDDDEALLAHSTETEREELRSIVLSTADWLYEDGEHASLLEYRDKLAECRPIYDKITFRITQRTQVSEIFPKFIVDVNSSLVLIRSYFVDRNITAEEQEQFDTTLNQIISDLQARLETQASLPLWEDPVVLVSEFEEHTKWLATQTRKFRARSYKITKPIPTPKPTPEEVPTSESTDEAPSTEESSPDPSFTPESFTPESFTPDNIEENSTSLEEEIL